MQVLRGEREGNIAGHFSTPTRGKRDSQWVSELRVSEESDRQAEMKLSFVLPKML